ncbi:MULTISPECIES: DUF6474 family protein [unclassified Dietzia]|uniref:DUF6474 family protein n=1 Tax=unclassified Dietzia TaxID=2617939 RepID=UPI000D2255D7|nr:MULTISPECIES: DUF6474 family protein [unclassified Dietzia]AVZ38322.1 hypothetical protein CT688_01265 [Dietzia sp. JS16-p6b]QGW23329.1 hypothetical protein GJR88_00412 [Dietzia sp. DQ12-45-1b]
MGKLTTYRDKRAELRAHAAALKATAMTEAKLAAKETRHKAKEAHRVELAEAKKRAKLAGRNADRKAKREAKRAKRQDALARKASRRDRKAEKTLAKQERATLKREAKFLAKDRKAAEKIEAAGRKHEYQLAEMELKKLEGTKLGKEDVQRWLSLAKVATPVLLPMVYKLVSNAQGSTDRSAAGAVDLRAAGIDATGPGAALGARIVRLEQTLDQLEVDRRGDRQVEDFLASTRSRLKDLRTAVETAETTPTAQRREVHSAISGELDRVNKDVLARLGVTP